MFIFNEIMLVEMVEKEKEDSVGVEMIRVVDFIII